MATNTRALLHHVVSELESAQFPTWIFGGWAEELQGLSPARPHSDIDLLYPAPDFNALDKYLAQPSIREIMGKHLPHKRAFSYNDVVIELFLVHPRTLTTNFWSTTLYQWPSNTLDHPHFPQLASREALLQYRRDWATIHIAHI